MTIATDTNGTEIRCAICGTPLEDATQFGCEVPTPEVAARMVCDACHDREEDDD